MVADRRDFPGYHPEPANLGADRVPTSLRPPSSVAPQRFIIFETGGPKTAPDTKPTIHVSENGQTTTRTFNEGSITWSVALALAKAAISGEMLLTRERLAEHVTEATGARRFPSDVPIDIRTFEKRMEI